MPSGDGKLLGRIDLDVDCFVLKSLFSTCFVPTAKQPILCFKKAVQSLYTTSPRLLKRRIAGVQTQLELLVKHGGYTGYCNLGLNVRMGKLQNSALG